MKFWIGALLAALVISSPRAGAVTPVFDLNVFYFSDSFTYSSVNSSYKRTFYDLMVGFGLTKKKSFVLGWDYSSMTFSDNPGTETSLKITDMGPKVMWYMDKERTWVVGFSYYLITKGDYSSGSTTTELRGSAMRGELGYLPMMWDGIMIGAKLNYYKATLKEEITNQTALAQVSNSRTVIYPSFAMTIRWD